MIDVAKISPNPSITPFTNDKSMLIDSEETKDQKRVVTGSVSSNTARVLTHCPMAGSETRVSSCRCRRGGHERDAAQANGGVTDRATTWTGTKMSATRADFHIAADPSDRASLPQPPAELG